ncbi:MAG: tetraacyldisaccharide 4'-kinase [Flavobacteriaceae bacterium]
MSKLRKLLYPFAIVYDVVTRVRNFCYDTGVFKSVSYNIPIIAVGNLSVGGTGKSPMIEYLIRLLLPEGQLATLSRGYKRQSEGFVLAHSNSTAEEIGDEPMQFHSNFPKIAVAVDANRQHGIQQLQKLVNPDVILLDDAFQHRKVTAGFYVLLTKYNDLFVDDLLLPAGNLRESKRGASRADVIVVTKCPNNLSASEQQVVIKKLNVAQKVFFTSIGYGNEVIGDKEINLNDLVSENVTLVTGIANPKPLVEYLKSKQLQFEHLAYKDHHNFTDKQLEELSKKRLILTTEKDYMRLKDKIKNVYYLPIVTEFISDELDFQDAIRSFVKK